LLHHAAAELGVNKAHSHEINFIVDITFLLSDCVAAPSQKMYVPKGKASLVCEKYTALTDK
jgi:hypothetical protein